jgi:hypothetical protein
VTGDTCRLPGDTPGGPGAATGGWPLTRFGAAIAAASAYALVALYRVAGLLAVALDSGT